MSNSAVFSSAGSDDSLVARVSSLPLVTPSDSEIDIAVLREVPHQFGITDEGSAAWLVRKVIAARTYAERVKAWADQELRRAAREEQTLVFLFGKQLQEWVRLELERQRSKRKSIALPPGTVGFRSVGPTLQVDNESAVLGWCRSNLPPAILIVEKLSRTTVKEHFEATGEVPDGTHVEPGCEKFFIR